MPARIAVLVSGGGTNLQALLDAPDPAYEVVGVLADRADAYGLVRAQQRGIPVDVVSLDDSTERTVWDARLAASLQAREPDWIVCAGFMRILGPPVLEAFPSRIVNTHPAILPSFPGAHAVRDALAYGVRMTGCTVHLVDAGVDTGPILDQRVVRIRDDDDEDSLHERIKVEERAMLVETVQRLCQHGCTVDGRKATIP